MGYGPAWYDYIFILGPPILMDIGTFLGVFFGVSLALRRWYSTKFREIGHSALEIARTRYALGEISGSEYERMREDLGAEPAFGSSVPVEDV